MKYGIGITTRNRRDVFENTLKQIRKCAPKNSRIVVVDDASEVPVKDAAFRFKHNAGVAASKNKCLELLKDCEHIFLFDDDCYPIKKGWADFYIDAGENHLMYIYGRPSKSIHNKVKYHTHPKGVMLYIRGNILESVGDFDCDFGFYGSEHIEFSSRFWRLGLTPHHFMDAVSSNKYIYSMDESEEAESTVTLKTKRMLEKTVQRKRRDRNHNHKNIPKQSPHGGIILASYFNYAKDWQRGTTWEADKSLLQPLIDSCKKFDIPIKIFTNCFDSDDIFIKISGSDKYVANNYRWFAYRDWLKENPQINVFMVDSTDVEVLRNPFNSIMKGRLYSGDESNKMNLRWMRERIRKTRSLKLKREMKKHRRETLLNCGIVGGDYDTTITYLNEICSIQVESIKPEYVGSDMPFHNYVAYKYFKNKITHGIIVNTTFKKYEYNDISFFKHK